MMVQLQLGSPVLLGTVQCCPAGPVLLGLKASKLTPQSQYVQFSVTVQVE